MAERALQLPLGAGNVLLNGGQELDLTVIPDGWQAVRFADAVLDVASGDWGLEQDDGRSASCRVIRGTDFTSAARGSFERVPVRFIRSTSIEKRQLTPGDLLIELSGGSADQPTGRLLLISDRLIAGSDLPVIFSNFVKRLQVRSGCDPDYVSLYWSMLYNLGRTRTYEKRTTGIRNFKLADFLENEVLLIPPLPEQRAMAHALRAVQQAKEATEAVIAATRELKQALLRHLFTYGPVPVEQADQVPLRETEIGPVPEDWQVVQLGEVCDVSTGTTPSTAKAEYYDGMIPFIKTSEIANNVIEGARTLVSQAALRDYRLKLYPKGTVFLAMYGQGKTRGQVALLNIEATTTQNTAAIVTHRSLDPRFFWFYLMRQYQALRGEGIQGHISHLNLGYVKLLKVPLPPLSEQLLISQALSAAEAKLKAEITRAAALEATFRALLHHLMTGKVRVYDLMPALEVTGVV